jgi:hypothetical protein
MHVDVVTAAFADETPTAPRQKEARALSQRPEARGPRRRRPSSADADAPPVSALVPLDAVPVLAVARTDVPWDDLGKLSTQLLLRLDGSSCTMAIVTGIASPPNEGVRELAALVRRGLVRLGSPVDEIPIDESPVVESLVDESLVDESLVDESLVDESSVDARGSKLDLDLSAV